jgi:hypothetical protein
VPEQEPEAPVEVEADLGGVGGLFGDEDDEEY